MSDDPIQSKPARAKYPIVLAEDDPAIANMLKIELTMAGYTNLTLAENGQVAIDAITHNKPKVALVDINMPIKNGFEAIDEVKKTGYDLGSTKLIFLSNSSSPDDMERSKALNAQYKLKSDLTPKELIDLVDNALSI